MDVKFSVGAVYGNTLPYGGEGISKIQGFLNILVIIPKSKLSISFHILLRGRHLDDKTKKLCIFGFPHSAFPSTNSFPAF